MRSRSEVILTDSLVVTISYINVAVYDEKIKPEDMTGEQLAYAKKFCNCRACHAMPTMPDAESAGTIGPPLIAMQARYPDKAKLRAQIWNALDANPASVMIPFGKNKVMTEQEIDKVTDFVYGL